MQAPQAATYTEKQIIAYYECDANNKIKISNIMRRAQQLCAMQMNYLQLEYEKLLESNMVFLLSKIGIIIYEMPYGNQRVTASTTPIGTEKAIFIRETNFEDENGKPLITIQTDWLLADPATRRIIRPQSFFEKYSMPIGERKYQNNICAQKYIRPPHFDASYKKEVKYSDIDCNQHLNNAVYGDIVCDSLPHEHIFKKQLNTLFISFKNEARLGETIEISVAKTAQDTFFIAGEHGAKECFIAQAVFKSN